MESIDTVQSKILPNITQSTTNHSTTVTPSPFNHIIQPIHFYPAPWPSIIFRSSPYQAYYRPYVVPAFPPAFYRTGASSSYPPDEDMMLDKQPIFPIDDELSEEEAIKELEAIRKELAQTMAARQQEDRVIFPSITVNPEQSSVTVSLKSFASLLRSISSRVTVTLTTRTILVPNISVKDWMIECFCLR